MKVGSKVIYRDYYDGKRKVGTVEEMNVHDIVNAEGGLMGNTIVADKDTRNKQLHWMSELVLINGED